MSMCVLVARKAVSEWFVGKAFVIFFVHTFFNWGTHQTIYILHSGDTVKLLVHISATMGYAD